MATERRAAKPLKEKALDSFKLAVDFFNSTKTENRHTAVYMFFQHAFEMLLKASIVQKGETIKKDNGETISIYECLTKYGSPLGLNPSEIGAIKVIDKARNSHQHFYIEMDEALVYAQVHAAVPAFEKLLFINFSERLGDHMPDRVIPLATNPPKALRLLLDSEFEKIKELLAPGSRKQDKARARIRGLLSMEAFESEDVADVSEKDVERVLRGIKRGLLADDLVPTFSSMSTITYGQGEFIRARFTRKDEIGAVPFRYSPDSEDAYLAIETDLMGDFTITTSKLNEALGIKNSELGKAIRWYLELESDRKYCRPIKHNATEHIYFSGAAISQAKRFLSVEGNAEKALDAYREFKKQSKKDETSHAPQTLSGLPSRGFPDV